MRAFILVRYQWLLLQDKRGSDEVTYVDEHGNPVQLVEQPGLVQSNQFVAAAPTAFNISPETFARLMQGGSLTPEEMASMSGEAASAPVEGALVPVVETQAATGEPKEDAVNSAGKKAKGSKKSLKSSKKKSKSCC